jgi:deazaflavin-dependent oxidoreductase (nitroreductase family)
MSWNDDVIEKFRESKGVTNHWGPKLVVMHTIGAKSGEERLAPVVGFPRDGGWQVVASKGGSPENPAWYHNLRTHPEIELEAIESGEIITVPVVATEVPAEDWKATYDSIAAEEPQFGEYLTKTDRQIPVFQLTRVVE